MADQPDSGAAEGFSARRVLATSVEVRRLLSRPSVRTVLIAMAVLPVALAGAVAKGKMQVSLDANYLSTVATLSGANFVVFALFVGSQLATTLMVAFIFGEAITREAHWSYLPVLLTTPVRRGQLLRQKAFACSAVCLIGLGLFAAASAAMGFVFFGTGPLIPVSGPHVPLAQMGWRFAAMLAYMALYAMWIAALAMWFSVLAKDNSVNAVGGTVAVVVLCHLFGGFSTLGLSRGFLPTRNFDAWNAFADAHVDWTRPAWGVFLSLLYAGLFALFGYGSFAAKDIRPRC